MPLLRHCTVTGCGEPPDEELELVSTAGCLQRGGDPLEQIGDVDDGSQRPILPEPLDVSDGALHSPRRRCGL